MKYYDFTKRSVFHSQRQLQRKLENSNIFLAAGSRLTFHGRIGLANNIEFEGDCSLGDGSSVASGSFIKNAKFGKNNQIRLHSFITDIVAADNNIFGPFCFVRDTCSVGNNCIVGSHVEMTRSSLSDDVKISHQAFVGDANISSGVIIGAGVVFCNYDDGKRKLSVVGHQSLVGSGSMLVGPTTIGAQVIIGAGSVVIGDVESRTTVIQKRPFAK